MEREGANAAVGGQTARSALVLLHGDDSIVRTRPGRLRRAARDGGRPGRGTGRARVELARIDTIPLHSGRPAAGLYSVRPSKAPLQREKSFNPEYSRAWPARCKTRYPSLWGAFFLGVFRCADPTAVVPVVFLIPRVPLTTDNPGREGKTNVFVLMGSRGPPRRPLRAQLQRKKAFVAQERQTLS